MKRIYNQGELLNQISWISLGMIVFCVVLIRVSWLNDDAYITFRIIQNFINGFGPVYNIGERVQVFTHPMWMLLVSLFYFFYKLSGIHLPGALPFISLLVSWLCIAVTLGVIALRTAGKPVVFLLGLWVLMGSRAFMDYAASGLENPLTFLLLAIFSFLYWRMFSRGQVFSPIEIFSLSFITGLATLNRMDAFLLFAPVILVVWWRSADRLRAIVPIVLGFLPFILWEMFSLLYFGFLFPNTAYAKLNSAVPAGSYIQQGILYLFNSITLDPLSLIVVFTILIVVLVQRDRYLVPPAMGILLYLLYVVRIGGDYMSGRFISTLLFASVLCFVQFDIEWESMALPIFLVVLAIGFASGSMPYLYDSSYVNANIDNKGISDERGFRFEEWGFIRITRNQLLPDFPQSSQGWVKDGPRDVLVSGAIGLQGYISGPEVHILDVMALADPLLARLPAKHPEHWRVGHIEREIPAGYFETLESGMVEIQNPSLATYYTQLKTIISDPVLQRERLITLIRFTIGNYDYYLDEYITVR